MHVAAACTREQLEQVLAKNPDVNAKDNFGRTALHFACRAGNLATCEVLFAIDTVDIDAPTKAGVTPLMMAIESGSIQLVALALNNNLNPFLKDALGRTALDYSKHYRDVMGQDMHQLINAAMQQWID